MIYYEDLALEETVIAGPLTVTAEEIVAFAQRYDPQRFHLSDEGAKDTIFGSLAASGWHTAALTMKLLMSAYARPLASLGSPGFDNLRWRRPVYPEDALRARVTVVEKRVSMSRPEMGLVHFDVQTLNQDDVVVMSYTNISMIERREQATEDSG